MSAPTSLSPYLQRRGGGSPALWIPFFLCAFVALGLFFVPAFIIRPFRHQSPHALLVAMTLRQHSPAGTLIATLSGTVLALVLWRTAGRWGKFITTVVLVLMAFSTVMSRLNYFEWMFHPVAGAQFVAQSESKLDPKEMIMSVRFNSDARAYPISQMAYHHILNDEVDGVPVAVTY